MSQPRDEVALSPAGKRRRLVRRVLVSAAAIASLLVALEVWLRRRETYLTEAEDRTVAGKRFLLSSDRLVRQTPRGKRLIPGANLIIRNQGAESRDIRMRINSLGFRDDEIPPTKKSDEYRVLVLGDSITWGDMLQPEDVYVEKAERYLQAAVPDRRIELVNAGTSDIGMTEELDILEERGLAVKPDAVMMAFYLNDSRPPWGFTGELEGRGWLRSHSVLAETLYRQFKLGLWLRRGGTQRFLWTRSRRSLDWRNDRDAFLKLAHLAEYDWGAAWEPSSWDVIDRGLDRLQELSKTHGFETVVVAFPVSYQVYASFVEDAPQRMIEERARRRGAHFLDLLPLLRQYRDDEDLFFDHCHPKEKANDLIGRAVAELLERELLGNTHRGDP